MHKRKSGFTLVELLVVIGIVAVLMGMLMTGLIIGKRAVKRAQTKQLVSSLEMACRLFEDRWGFLPHDEDSKALGVTIDNNFEGLTGTDVKLESIAVLMLQLLSQKKDGPYLEVNEDDILLTARVTPNDKFT